jgi:hypothetical protein
MQPMSGLGGGGGGGWDGNEPPLLEGACRTHHRPWGFVGNRPCGLLALLNGVRLPFRGLAFLCVCVCVCLYVCVCVCQSWESTLTTFTKRSDPLRLVAPSTCCVLSQPGPLIQSLAVLNPGRSLEPDILDDDDLAGPLLYCLLFGGCLLLVRARALRVCCREMGLSPRGVDSRARCTLDTSMGWR